MVYAGISTHEAAARLMTHVRSLRYSRTQLLLSGPLANEEKYEMAREEIRERLGLPICRLATDEDGQWIPSGDELACAIVDRE
jgi:hypothetical protein